jgi:outer membrane receptor protein involved in Fe transport
LKPVPVASYAAWDVRVAYIGNFAPRGFGKTWTAALGVNNFTDRMPPLSPQAFTDNNADAATYSPIGRLIYASVGIKF